MESFPSQSPEISIEDDDDETADSSRERKTSRHEEPETASLKEESREAREPIGDKQPEKPKNEDGAIPLESLADDELRLVAQQYIDGRAEALKTELVNAPENSPDEAVALANATMLEAIEAKLSQGETPGEQIVEDAIAETAQELDIDVPETEEQTQTDEATEIALPETSDETEEQPDSTDPTAVPTAITTSTGNTIPNVPSPNNPIVPTIQIPGPGPASGNPNNSGGGNNLPPQTPVRGYGGIPPFNPNYNVNNLPATPNVAPPSPPSAPEQVTVKHNAAAPYLLLGYLIGRRRGRIKTEEKLLPIQKKLEKEVSDLHKNIAAGEEKIRRLAREKAEAIPGVAAKMAERLEERKKTEADKTHKAEVAPPAKEIKIKPEKLGMLAVTKEEAPSDKPEAPLPVAENKPKTPEPLKVPERPKDPTHMSVAELLVIASHIPIEQGNIKKLYEKNLLTEQGLREVTKAYLKGERYDSLVYKSRAQAEAHGHKNYETDPSVISSREVNNAFEKSHAPAKSADHSWSPQDYAEHTHSVASSDVSSQSVGKSDPPKSGPRVATSALTTAAVLAAIVLLLFMLRR